MSQKSRDTRDLRDRSSKFLGAIPALIAAVALYQLTGGAPDAHTEAAAQLTTSAFQEQAGYRVSAVRSVYDGDTFRADIAGWPSQPSTNLPIRVLGVDTPEIKGRCAAEVQAAKRARAYTEQLLNGGTVTLSQVKVGQDRYQRVLARVLVNGQDLAQLLIQQGLGRPYNGGKRSGWCP